MSICYWQLCHCPDATPCSEHQGIKCSLFNGATVTSASEVKDSVTRGLEAAILMLAHDQNRIDAVKAKLETEKSNLEREKSDIEREAHAAKDRTERRAVEDHANKTNEKIKKLADELSSALDELDAMTMRWQTAVSTGSSRLMIPYSDASGYCACYDRKKQRLALLAGRISAEQATYAALLAQYNTLKASILPVLLNVKTWATGLVSLAILLAWLWFAFNEAALIAILVGLIVVALALLGLIMQVVSLQSQMDASQRRLALLILIYYRLQRISTCQKEQAELEDEWDWFEQFLGDLDDIDITPH